MRLTVALAIAVLLTAAPATAAPGAIVRIDAATQRRLGVVTTPLVAARRTAAVSGFARVIDAVPLASLDADIAAAAAALAASQAEATRTRALNAADQTVSRKASEAAGAQARADAAKLALLRRRVALEWGPSMAALSDARRARLIGDIAAGRAALLRIDAAGVAPGQGVIDLDLGAAGRTRATVLGPARTADVRLQSAGVLALVSGPVAMRLGAGAVYPARIPQGTGGDGVVIPRAALLRTAGQTFAYVRRDAGSFERRAVQGGVSDPAGLFAAAGFRAGQAVVTAGASQLFAAENAAMQAN